MSRKVTSAGLAAVLATLVLACVARDATVAEARAVGDGHVASVGDGDILLDGHPFFMIGSWWQCAADVDRNLALGINVFVASLCDERALAERLGDRAWMIGSIDGDESLPSSIGYLQPDEPDVHGIPGSVVKNRGQTAHALAVTGVGMSRRTSAIAPGQKRDSHGHAEARYLPLLGSDHRHARTCRAQARRAG